MFDLIYRYDPENIKPDRLPRDGKEAKQLLTKGNRKFVDITDLSRTKQKTHVIPFNPRAFGWGVEGLEAPAQVPFAAILGCADARVPPEMVFCKGCNELFVVRVAGNVLGQECLGSLRYAVNHFPSTLKLLVVLAHAKCGAVSEAVDVYLQPRHYLEIATDPSIRSLVDQILVAVRVAVMGMEELYGSQVLRSPQRRGALIEATVALNAAWNAHCLHQEFRNKFPDVGVVFGAYDLISRCVRLPISPSDQITDEEKGLFAPPGDAEEFRQLARRICSGKLVQCLLGQSKRAA
jgi:carbonic anhydrase